MWCFPRLSGYDSRYFTLRKLYLLNDNKELEQFECKYCGSIIVDNKINIEIDNECVEANRTGKLKYEEDMKIYNVQLTNFKTEVERYKEIINTHNNEIDHQNPFKRMSGSKWEMREELYHPTIVKSERLPEYYPPVTEYPTLTRPTEPVYSEVPCKYITCPSCKRKNYVRGMDV